MPLDLKNTNCQVLYIFVTLMSLGFGFFAYETFKEVIIKTDSALTKISTETGETVLTPVGGLLCGALAGACSQTVA